MRCNKMQINANKFKKCKKNATPQPMYIRSNSTTAFPQQWMLKVLPSHYHTRLNLPSISPINMSIFVMCRVAFGKPLHSCKSYRNINQEAGKLCQLTSTVGPKSSQSRRGVNGIVLHPTTLMPLSPKGLVACRPHHQSAHGYRQHQQQQHLQHHVTQICPWILTLKGN